MEHLFSSLTEDTKLRMWCIEKASESNSDFNEEKLALANKIYRFITEKNKIVHTKTAQYPEYAQLYILRDFDLLPEMLADYPTFMNRELAKDLTELGLIFNTKEEALAARELMLKAISSQ